MSFRKILKICRKGLRIRMDGPVESAIAWGYLLGAVFVVLASVLTALTDDDVQETAESGIRTTAARMIPASRVQPLGSTSPQISPWTHWDRLPQSGSLQWKRDYTLTEISENSAVIAEIVKRRDFIEKFTDNPWLKWLGLTGATLLLVCDGLGRVYDLSKKREERRRNLESADCARQLQRV